MKNITLLVFVTILSFTFTSCSNNDKSKDAQAQETLAEGDDISIDDSDFVVDADEETDEIEQTADASETLDDETAAVAVADTSEDEILLEDNVESEVQVTKSAEYTAQKGETLMWIAFKVYGDYRKWKELKEMNADVLANGLQAGDKLKYTSGNFEWNPRGLPHLIRNGDTLGVISNEKYGTAAKWRSIWDNNRDMIKDPNLIFAGFTLYYIPEERDMASSDL